MSVRRYCHLGCGGKPLRAKNNSTWGTPGFGGTGTEGICSSRGVVWAVVSRGLGFSSSGSTPDAVFLLLKMVRLLLGRLVQGLAVGEQVLGLEELRWATASNSRDFSLFVCLNASINLPLGPTERDARSGQPAQHRTKFLDHIPALQCCGTHDG